MSQQVEDSKCSKYILMIVLQSILYGLMDVISKRAYVIMPVYCFLFLRYILAAFIMFSFWHRRIIFDIKSVRVRKYILPSLCMSLAFIFSNLALQYTTATNMSFIRSLSTIIVPALLLIFYKQRYKRTEVLLQPFILIGLYLLCAKGGLGGFGIGEVFALVAAVLIAGSLVFGSQALRYISAESLSFVQTVLAIVVCGIMSVVTKTIEYTIYALNVSIILSLFYAAIGCTIGGYMLQNVALKHVSAKIIGVVQCLYPIATAIIAYIVLGEALSAAGVVGAVMLLACVILENAFVKE